MSPRNHHALGAEPEGSATCAVPVPGLPPGLGLEREMTYSLRIPADGGQAACPRCGHCWPLGGPTAYADDDPICDLCLLTSEQQLGMVLALVSTTRLYANLDWDSPEDHREGLVELGAFARIYERFAARYGPPRVFDLGTLRARYAP